MGNPGRGCWEGTVFSLIPASLWKLWGQPAEPTERPVGVLHISGDHPPPQDQAAQSCSCMCLQLSLPASSTPCLWLLCGAPASPCGMPGQLCCPFLSLLFYHMLGWLRNLLEGRICPILASSLVLSWHYRCTGGWVGGLLMRVRPGVGGGQEAPRGLPLGSDPLDGSCTQDASLLL